jgi:poly(beta-D-mannuronate) lyase
MRNVTNKLMMAAGFFASTLAISAQANYVQDPELTAYRANQGNSDVWISHEDSAGGKGDVGSSGSTAFGEQGSSRFRFEKKYDNHDFTAKPGLSQVVTGLPANSDMTYSLYYCDTKGPTSASTLYFGVREVVEGQSLAGKAIAESRAHARDLDDAPKGDVKSCFRQVKVDFNSGSTGNVEIFALMEANAGDDGQVNQRKEVEVRVDSFAIEAK